MSRTKLRILFLEFEYEVLCRLQAESEAVMGLINKEKVLHGVGKAVDAANNAADKVHDYAKEKELDKKAEEAVHKTENFIRENEIFYRRIFMRKMVSVMFQAHRCCGHFVRREVS